MVTLIPQHLVPQDLAHLAVSDPLAEDDAPITRPAETGFSVMGQDHGSYDVLSPGGVPGRLDFSVMGQDHGSYDVLSPDGVPRKTTGWSLPGHRAQGRR